VRAAARPPPPLLLLLLLLPPPPPRPPVRLPAAGAREGAPPEGAGRDADGRDADGADGRMAPPERDGAGRADGADDDPDERGATRDGEPQPADDRLRGDDDAGAEAAGGGLMRRLGATDLEGGAAAAGGPAERLRHGEAEGAGADDGMPPPDPPRGAARDGDGRAAGDGTVEGGRERIVRDGGALAAGGDDGSRERMVRDGGALCGGAAERGGSPATGACGSRDCGRGAACRVPDGLGCGSRGGIRVVRPVRAAAPEGAGLRVGAALPERSGVAGRDGSRSGATPLVPGRATALPVRAAAPDRGAVGVEMAAPERAPAMPRRSAVPPVVCGVVTAPRATARAAVGARSGCSARAGSAAGRRGDVRCTANCDHSRGVTA
jgi:hypothetical protein